MKQIYTPIVSKVSDATTKQIEAGLAKAEEAAKAAVAAKVAAGQIPAAAQPAAEAAAVAQAQQAAAAQIEKQIPVANVASDGTVTLDFSNAALRAPVNVASSENDVLMFAGITVNSSDSSTAVPRVPPI